MDFDKALALKPEFAEEFQRRIAIARSIYAAIETKWEPVIRGPFP
jgi:hypothetical protein